MDCVYSELGSTRSLVLFFGGFLKVHIGHVYMCPYALYTVVFSCYATIVACYNEGTCCYSDIAVALRFMTSNATTL